MVSCTNCATRRPLPSPLFRAPTLLHEARERPDIIARGIQAQRFLPPSSSSRRDHQRTSKPRGHRHCPGEHRRQVPDVVSPLSGGRSLCHPGLALTSGGLRPRHQRTPVTSSAACLVNPTVALRHATIWPSPLPRPLPGSCSAPSRRPALEAKPRLLPK